MAHRNRTHGYKIVDVVRFEDCDFHVHRGSPFSARDACNNTDASRFFFRRPLTFGAFDLSQKLIRRKRNLPPHDKSAYIPRIDTPKKGPVSDDLGLSASPILRNETSQRVNPLSTVARVACGKLTASLYVFGTVTVSLFFPSIFPSLFGLLVPLVRCLYIFFPIYFFANGGTPDSSCFQYVQVVSPWCVAYR